MTTTRELEPPPGSQFETTIALTGAWFKTWPVQMAAALLILLLLVASPRGSTSVTWTFGIWFLVFLAAQGAQIWNLRQSRRSHDASLQADRWTHSMRLHSAGMGILWGALPLLVFARLGGAAQQFLTLTILMGILFTAMQVMADRKALPAFLLPSTAGLLLAWSAWGIHLPLHHAALIGAALGICVLLGRCRLHEFASHHRLLEEKVVLAEQLHRKNVLLESINKSRTQILAVASHDLRQPVHALGLMLEQLRINSDSAPCRDQVEMITGVVQTLSHSLETLLDIARLDAGGVRQKPRDFDLRQLLDQLAIEFQAEAQNKGLQLNVDCPALMVHSDEALLQSVLANLISNAIRYTDTGSISVKAFCEEEHASMVRVAIRDTGRGIPKEHLQDIFQEYVRLNPGSSHERGLGLGLAIVKRTVDILGCTVQVESELARGSTFSITVPKSVSGGLPPAHALSRSQFTLLGCCGIIVDNDKQVLQSMGATLAAWGCDLVTARSCEDLERKIACLSRNVDFLMVDFHLGGERTGLDAIRMVREAQRRSIPAIVLTGDVEVHLDNAMDGLNLEVVHKPVSPARLRAMVEAVVLRQAAH